MADMMMLACAVSSRLNWSTSPAFFFDLSSVRDASGRTCRVKVVAGDCPDHFDVVGSESHNVIFLSFLREFVSFSDRKPRRVINQILG